VQENSEEDVMKKAAVIVGSVMMALVVPGLRSQDKDRAELAKAVTAAKVSLEQGLSTSASEGKLISAKFEIEDGKLQLSIYTAKGDSFSEVAVDYNTGKAAKTEAITSGEDRAIAQGFALTGVSDEERLAREFPMYDALYEYVRQQLKEQQP
jgi:hypothetical protein